MFKKFLQKLFPSFYSGKAYFREYFVTQKDSLLCPISSGSDELKREWYKEALEILEGRFDKKNQEHLIKVQILNARYIDKLHKEWGLNSLEGFFN